MGHAKIADVHCLNPSACAAVARIDGPRGLCCNRGVKHQAQEILTQKS